MQCLLCLVVCITFVPLTTPEVTEKDLQEQLRINVTALNDVTWKDWVNNNPSIQSGGKQAAGPCIPPLAPQGIFYDCCNDSTPCNQTLKLSCINGVCECMDGYDLNYVNGTIQICKRIIELGAQCTVGDICVTPSAVCQNGICACPPGTIRANDMCTESSGSWQQFIKSDPSLFVGKKCVKTYEEVDKNFGSCCQNDSQCNSTMGLLCNDGMCDCKNGLFLNNIWTKCETRPAKELGQACSSTDNCHAAFAYCNNSLCACKSDFIQVNDVCKPAEYGCPFKKPLTINAGLLWPCNFNSSEPSCPKGFWCLAPALGPRAEFLTESGIEQTYCCPDVPNLNVTEIEEILLKKNQDLPPKIFQDVCLYGKVYSGDFDLLNEDEYYEFPGIGVGSIPCLKPCLEYPAKQPVIKNGKCIRYKRW